MKPVAKLLSAAIIATASASAMAQFPSSANETTSLWSIFPEMTTYADRHRNDPVRVADVPYPSSANETTALSSTVPTTRTFADLHKDTDRRASSAMSTGEM